MANPLLYGVSSEAHSAARSAYSFLSAFAASANRLRGTTTHMTEDGASVSSSRASGPNRSMMKFFSRIMLINRWTLDDRFARTTDQRFFRPRPSSLSSSFLLLPSYFILLFDQPHSRLEPSGQELRHIEAENEHRRHMQEHRDVSDFKPVLVGGPVSRDHGLHPPD